MGEDLTFEMLVPETLLNWRRRALAAEARAQHLDELELEVRKLCAYVEDLPTDEMVSGMSIVKRIDAILAKIERNPNEPL